MMRGGSKGVGQGSVPLCPAPWLWEPSSGANPAVRNALCQITPRRARLCRPTGCAYRARRGQHRD